MHNMPDDLQQLIDVEFPLRDDVHYLNHAAVAPWPRRTSEAVCRFARQNIELSGKPQGQRDPRIAYRERDRRPRLAGAGTPVGVA